MFWGYAILAILTPAHLTRHQLSLTSMIINIAIFFFCEHFRNLQPTLENTIKSRKILDHLMLKKKGIIVPPFILFKNGFHMGHSWTSFLFRKYMPSVLNVIDFNTYYNNTQFVIRPLVLNSISVCPKHENMLAFYG